MRTMSVMPRLQQLCRQAHIADFGHSGIALSVRSSSKPECSSHRHPKVGMVDAFFVVFDVLEYDGAAAMLHEMRRSGGGLSTAPSGARLPRRTAIPPCSTRGFSSGRITSEIPVRSSLAILPDGLAVDGQGIAMNQVALIERANDSRQPPA
jgi:hypothetical protein